MRITVVSPSAPSVHNKQRQAQFDSGLATLKKLGVEYTLAPHALGTLNYIASTAAERLSDLEQAYRNPSVKLILAANGGWSAGHLLGGLNYDLIKQNPKPLAGASDITVLLNAIYAKTGVPQLYGPMVTWGFERNDPTTNQSFMAMTQQGAYSLPTSQFGTWLRPGPLQGVLVGGNLVSVATLLGTPYEPDWHDKIFVWEETDETVSRLDRALTQFKNAGVWSKIGGMIIGHLDQIDEEFAGTTTSAARLITEHFAEYDFPILKTDLFGHNTPTELTMAIGGTATANNTTLTFATRP